MEQVGVILQVLTPQEIQQVDLEVKPQQILAGGIDATNPPALTTTESWDGITWVTTANLANGRNQSGGAGTGNSSGAVFGGDNSATLSSTEEYSAAYSDFNIRTITTS